MEVDGFDHLYKQANKFFEENSYKLVSNFWDEFDDEKISENGLLIVMTQEESSEKSIGLYN
jgi:hypothetical protein